MKHCLNCQNEVSEKATYCSDKCRIAYTRRTKKGEQPEQSDPIYQPEQATRTGLSETDKLFNNWRPSFYTFGDKEREDICFACNKKFATNLQLLKFCSPECMSKLQFQS